MKSIFLSMLATATLASCSDIENGNGDKPASGEAFLTLNIQIPTKSATRADGAVGTATENETTINKLFILGYNAAGDKLDKITVAKAELGNLPTSGTATLPAKPVSADLATVFVIANPTLDLETRINNSTTFAQLSAVLTATVEDFTGAASDNFTMVNAFANNTGVDEATGLVTVVNTDPKNLTVAVALERLVSKIEVTQAAAAEFAGANLPAGCDAFSIKGYELTTTNKTTMPFSAVKKYNTDKVYREDANYSGAVAKDNTQFNWMVGATANAYADWKNVSAPGTDAVITYCLENTIDGSKDVSVGGAVTKVIVKAEYLIAGVPTAQSWVMLDGVAMSLDALKAEHARLKAAPALNPTILALLDAFLLKCTNATDFALLAEANLNTEASYEAVTVAGNTDGKLFKLYQKSMCYYELPIHHDARVTAEAADKLGRWGVVRNNSYTINFTGVTGLGAPTITDDVQGEPDFELDPAKANLIATISVNPWATWLQEGPLEPR